MLVVAPTPPEAAWRWRVGKVPILWDLGLHAVGLLGAEEVQALTAAEYANQKLVRLHGGHTDVEVRYSDVGDCTTVVDGSEQDWTAIFDRQLEHVLDGSAVRRQVEAFEVECAIHRLEDECESS